MTRAKISEYSATAGDNTDVNGVNIAEGCPPSSMNNMGREIMAALKRFQTGTDGDSVTVGGQLAVTGTTTTSPAIVAAGDTNTGIFFPAADTIAFAEGGAEAMRITSAGEVLVGGTTAIGSADGSLTIQKEGAPTLNFFRDDTSVVSPNPLGTISFYGNDTTSNTPTEIAYIEAVASGTHQPGDNPTDLVFGTTPDGSETVAEVARFTQDKYLRFASGTGGIQFGGDTAAANALDDYEEGTWTPEIADAQTGGNVGSATFSSANYIKIGSFVTVNVIASNINTTGLTAANVFYIRNLPFVSVSGNSSYGSCATDSVTYQGGRTMVTPGIGSSDTWMSLVYSGSGLTDTALDCGDITSGTGDIFLTITYQAA